MKLRFTRQAIQDIESVYDYIAEENPIAAQSVLDQIESLVGQLPLHPKLGRSGRVADTRELVIPNTPYLVTYRITDFHVDILAIIHSARRWPVKL